MSKKLRVVGTGLGILAANGIGVDAFWTSLIAKRSGVDTITLFDPRELTSRIAGEVRDFDPAKHIGPHFKAKRFARHTLLAIAATRLALEDAQFKPKEHSFSVPLPIFLGVSTSAMEMIEMGSEQLNKVGPRGVSPFVVPSSPPQATASAIADHLGVPTQTTTISTACPSGLDAIGFATRMIRSGHSPIAIAGGADSPITRLSSAVFTALGLISTHNAEPKKASRPFASENSGVMAEGSGVVFLETLEHALARGATPHFEITGYASCMDTSRDEPGSGLEMTMMNALADAGRRADEVDYICAHGAGNAAGDRTETRTIKKVFGERAYRIPVSSIKGVTGNPLAAAGPFQVIASALALKSGVVPPTTNCDEPDPSCDLDYVSDRARHAELGCLLINCHGIAGTNTSMVIEKVKV
jgi:3-oxoacyl-[acyl-carrier-protein] synthase II